MGEQLFDAVGDRLKPVLYTDKSYTWSVKEILLGKWCLLWEESF